jgi:hypothetical protein
MTHLSIDELRRWLETPSETDRGRILKHLATCEPCASRYAELVRTIGEPVTETPADVSAFLARGRAMRPPQRTAAWWAARLVPLAAAAAALLFIVAMPRPPVDTGVVTRGGSLRAAAPQGTIAAPLEFRWESDVAASRYLIEVVDGSGRRVLEARTDASPYRLPEDSREPLESGVDYRWMVTALDPRGEPLATSALTTFRIR